MPRRDFLKAAALAATATAASVPSSRAQSTAAGARPAVGSNKVPFRIVFSSDIHAIVDTESSYRKEGELFRPEMLEAAIDETAGIGIDVHKMVPGFGWVPRWKSKSYPIEEHWKWYVQKFGEPKGKIREQQMGYIQYALDGGDYTQLFINRCRAKGLAPFVSLRLNDEQGGEGPEGICRFGVENTHLELGASGYTKGVEHLMNWIHPEVRRYKETYIDELARYDLDGLELDFMRRPTYFRLDQTTRDDRVQIMANFVRRARKTLDKHSKPGKHRHLCVRIPCHLEDYDSLGIDLQAFAEAGVDVFNLSPSMATQQQTDLAAIKQKVPNAAVFLEITDLSDKPVRGHFLRRPTDEEFYTAAHLAYSRGAQGLFTFNFWWFAGKLEYRKNRGMTLHRPPFHIFKNIRDPAWVARQPQHYYLARGYGGHEPKLEDTRNAYMMRHAKYKPQSPLPCRMETAGQWVLMIMDLAPPTGGWKGQGRLRIQAAASLAGRQFEMAIGRTPVVPGTTLQPTDDVSAPYPSRYTDAIGKPEDHRAWVVPAELLVNGGNRFVLTLKSGEPVDIVRLDLAIA